MNHFNIKNVNALQAAVTGALLGCVVYILIYGFTLLDVTYTEWLYYKGDLTQHQVGWMFFRNSDWYFPIGLMDNVNYPSLYPVSFTDSIPLFAVIFKVLSPILPDHFQYFGLWGLFCYAMQGLFGALLTQKITENGIFIMLGSLIFAGSQWMFHRLYMHSSLAAHWLLLAAMLVCVNGKELSFRKHIIFFSILTALASAIHIYFIPMLMIYLGCDTLKAMWENKKKPLTAGLCFAGAFIPLFSSILVLYILGAFTVSSSFAGGGFGEASANLNFLFNPVGTSRIFSDLPNPLSKWPQESYGYLGLGLFMLTALAVILTISKRNIRAFLFKNKTAVVFTVLMLLISLLVATSPTVAINEHVLFYWNMHPLMEWVLEVFRSLGRFVWLICYAIVYFDIAVIAIAADTADKTDKCSKNRVYVPAIYAGIVVLTLFMQIYDLEDFYKGRREWVISDVSHGKMTEEKWDGFADQYEHIYTFEESNWQGITIYAAEHHKTLNMTYLARLDSQALIEDWGREWTALINGRAADDQLYVFLSSLGTEMFKDIECLNVYYIDGYYIGSKERLNGMDDFIVKEKVL